jgi:molybdopterin/thiamine biosynthesis adenylyltransferase
VLKLSSRILIASSLTAYWRASVSMEYSESPSFASLLKSFSRRERHNLDRLLHATKRDIGRLKIDVIGDALKRNATAASPTINRVPYSVVEELGFREAMDCDVLFSCVDRPWGRYILNYLAYAYQIPVIDGGISIRTRYTRMQLERQGYLDNPSYMDALPVEHNLNRNENVFPFSAHLASSLVGHMLHVVLKPASVPDLGEQIYHFSDGSIESTAGAECYQECYFRGIIGRGDAEGLPITGSHQAAEVQRMRQKSLCQPWWTKLSRWLKQ